MEATARTGCSSGGFWMTRTYSLVIEGGPGSYSAYVPELHAILVTGKTLQVLTRRAKEAIRLYFEAMGEDRSPTAMVREVEVELPAWAVVGPNERTKAAMAEANDPARLKRSGGFGNCASDVSERGRLGRA